jgi:hypothetical protein
MWKVSPVNEQARSEARDATAMSSDMHVSACVPRVTSRPAPVLVKFGVRLERRQARPRLPSVEAKCELRCFFQGTGKLPPARKMK